TLSRLDASRLATLSRKRERGKQVRLASYFFNTRTGLPASHCLMSSTICV
ncbi:MAG: hypothetical protein QOF14_5044, partial [Hyphomicrobiales bacterium]|nr:hypothetical protein [Hyphomicrobiales bacterium]